MSLELLQAIPLLLLAGMTVVPLLMATPQRLLAAVLILGAAILAVWNWVAARNFDAPGGALAAAFLHVTILAAAIGVATGAFLRLVTFLLQPRPAPTADMRGREQPSARTWLLLLLFPLSFAPRACGRPAVAAYDWRDFQSIPRPVRAALEIADSPARPWRTTTTLALLCTEPGELRLLERTPLPVPKPSRLPATGAVTLVVGRDLGRKIQVGAELVALGAADTILTGPVSAAQVSQLASWIGTEAGQEIYFGGMAQSRAVTESVADAETMRQFAALCRPRRPSPPISLQPAFRPLV